MLLKVIDPSLKLMRSCKMMGLWFVRVNKTTTKKNALPTVGRKAIRARSHPFFDFDLMDGRKRKRRIG